MNKLYFLLAYIIVFGSCTVKEDQSLKNSVDFPVGSAISHRWIKKDSLARKVFLEEFNSLTAENSMKMHKVQPKEGEFNFEQTDYYIDLADEFDLRIHGHALNWYISTPKWVDAYEGDSAGLEKVLENHIKTYAGNYAGKIDSWDVVNEALADETGGYRDCIWYRTLGDDYIARAFRYAREADSFAKLFYNEYYLESDTAKLETCLAMVDDFIERGIPIDGIGLQFHLYMDHPSVEAIEHALEEFVKRDLLIHISELDITFNHHRSEPVYSEFTSEMAEQQRQRYFEVVDAFMRIVPEDLRYGVSVWGFTDKYTWIRGYFKIPAWPCLFDDSLDKKPAYYGFRDGLNKKQK